MSIQPIGPDSVSSSTDITHLPVAEVPPGQPSGKIKRLMGRLGVAATCGLPPADLALSDTVFAKASNWINDNVTPATSHLAERIAQFGTLSAVIFAESFLVGMLIKRNKTIRNSFEAFDEYTEARQGKMSPPRRALSKALNAPFVAIKKVGEKVEGVGGKVSEQNFRGSEKIGKLISDIGTTNAIGTSSVVLNESMKGGISTGRVAEVSAIITASWLPTSEGVRHSYRGLKHLGVPGEWARSAMATTGRTLDTLTSMNVLDPLSTPVGTLFLAGAAGCLATTGWRIARSQESDTNVVGEVLNFPMQNAGDGTLPLPPVA